MLPNKLYLSDFGTKGVSYALGVSGDNQFVEYTQNLLVNYGVIGTGTSFHRRHDSFGYFVINIDKFYNALEQYFQNLLWIENRDRGATVGCFKILAKQRASDFFHSIVRENFMQNYSTTENHYYQLPHKVFSTVLSK